MFKIRLLIVFIAIISTLPLRAKPLSSESRVILRAVSLKSQKRKNWTASFTQETYSPALGKGTFNQGEFVFSYPDKFRYSLKSPEASDFYSNGSEGWYLQFPKGRDKPAQVRHFKTLKNVGLDRYMILLRGINTLTPSSEKKLLADFEVTGEKVEDELHVSLEPRKSSDIIRIRLIFKNDDDVLYRGVIEDAVGAKTTITLSEHATLKKVDPNSFKPQIQKGSTIEEL